MAPVVYLQSVVALTGRFPALAGVDLVVERATCLVLQGPNGVGKTSLLRVCAGLLPATSGSVLVLGADPRVRRSDVRRRIGFLGHGSAFYDDLTVAENLRFAVKAARGDETAVAGAMERWGLSGRLTSTTVGKLSAGQRRRVALAALSARSPTLVLLDEPHAALDAEARSLLNAWVEEVVAEGATVIVVSHEPEESSGLADRIVTMAGGIVVGDRTIRAAADREVGSASQECPSAEPPRPPSGGEVPEVDVA